MPIPFDKTNPTAELRRVWKGKYPLPAGSHQLQFTPFAPKSGGGFVGALYKKAPTKPGKTADAAKTWLGKPGFAYRGFEKSSEIERTRSITRRGLDAIAEKIAGDAYHAANTGRYFIPKHRLGLLPVRHAFLQAEHQTLVDFALGEINKNRPVPITEAIHVFSKWIEGFQDLASLHTRFQGTVIPFMDAITTHQYLPETVFVDGQDGPLIGLIDILAVSRLLADSDVLGGKGDNAGIIVYRNPQGQSVVAKAVKIDPGFAFNFRGHENKFQRTRAALALEDDLAEDMLQDLKDIQFGNNHPVNIRWERLSAPQQCDFLLAMQQGELALGEGKMIEMLLLRGGDFKLKGEDLVQEATAVTLAKQWRDNIRQQQKCYEREVLRHRTTLAQRQTVQEDEWAGFASRLKADIPGAAAASVAVDVERPDEYLCPITYELMRDPVMTPSGRSFERAAIENWIRAEGTDPLTREPLALAQLFPNLSLRTAIERFQAAEGAAPRHSGKIAAAEALPAQSAITKPTPSAAPPARVAAAAAAGLFAPPRRASAQAAAVNQADVHKLLLHVARGEQDQAEALLKIKGNEALLLHKGSVTDYSNRTFKNISAFQYALWALDWHMWKMLMKYLPRDKAAEQLQDLETNKTEHGQHYDFSPLLQALSTYIDKYEVLDKAFLNKKKKEQDLTDQWIKGVGGAQTTVPAHVANEYCRPDRSFYPRPSFTEDTLPRTFDLYEDNKFFPLAKSSWGSLSSDFGIYRGRSHAGLGGTRHGRGARPYSFYVHTSVPVDLIAITGLCEIRTGQYQELKRELTARLGARPS